MLGLAGIRVEPFHHALGARGAARRGLSGHKRRAGDDCSGHETGPHQGGHEAMPAAIRGVDG